MRSEMFSEETGMVLQNCIVNNHFELARNIPKN